MFLLPSCVSFIWMSPLLSFEFPLPALPILRTHPLQATLPIPPGLRLQALQMYLVLSPPTRIRHQSLMMVAQRHAILAASQREESLLVFSSQGGTLLGFANLGIALMKLRLITRTRLPTMMATPLILPLPLLSERINSLFILNFYFLYFYFPFVSFMFVHRTTFTLVAQAYACYGTSPLNVSNVLLTVLCPN
jgi:hypothetical protein